VTSRHARYPFGAALLLLAGAALSTGGVIVRHIDGADGWQILFFRSAAVIVILMAVLLVRYRGAIVAPFRAIGRDGLIYAVGLGLGFAAFIQAITLTAVANVVIIESTTPLFAAVAGWFLLGERIPRSMVIAIGVAIIGIAVMIGDTLESGGMRGNLIAIGVPLSTVVVVMVVRRSPHTDMMPATVLAAVVGAVIGIAAAGSADIPVGDIGLASLMGLVQIVIGFSFINIGSRYVPAADAGLYVLAEVFLAPLWVWMVINEVPTTLTFLGGSIVMAAVIGASLERRRASKTVTVPVSESR
jgi:drug/metabolite transporter (DMT)-like permease